MTKKNTAPRENTEARADMDLTIGEVSPQLLASLQLEEADPLKGLDAVYVPGQDGFEAGQIKLGLYIGTKRCTSTVEKKPNWKPTEGTQFDKNGKPVPGSKVWRDMHQFKAVDQSGKPTGKTFGIFSVGVLGYALSRVKPGQLIGIRYLGLGDAPLKQGQSAPHTFQFFGKDLDLNPADLDAHMLATAGAAGVAVAASDVA